MRAKNNIKLSYHEGDWFAIPLEDGGFAVGIIARSSKQGKVLFGYFFGPRVFELPQIEKLTSYSPEKALLNAKFGDYSLYHGEWPILGRLANWHRSNWPMVPFSRIEDNTKAIKVYYSEDDPSICIKELECSIAEAKTMPVDGMLGSHIVAHRLNKLL